MADPQTIEDARGRKLTLRVWGPVAQMDLYEAAGLDVKGRPVLHLVGNQAWMGMAMLAARVSDIDGVPVPIPTNVGQIKALVERLGDDGINVIAKTVGEGLASLEASADIAKN